MSTVQASSTHEKTPSTMADEVGKFFLPCFHHPDHLSKSPDQLIEDMASKSSNHEDFEHNSNPEEKNMMSSQNQNKKSKGIPKNLISNHDPTQILGAILSDRRATRATPAHKVLQNIPVDAEGNQQPITEEQLNELKHRPKNLRTSLDKGLNKIFTKQNNPDEFEIPPQYTKESFENIFQMHKRKAEVLDNEYYEPVEPTKILVHERLVLSEGIKETFPTNRIAVIAGTEKTEAQVYYERNMLSFLNQDPEALTFPRELPSLRDEDSTNPLDELKEKVQEVNKPTKIAKRIAQLPLNIDRQNQKQQKIDEINTKNKHPNTYINCDLRYFNFDFLVDKLGNFDVILMDPPWRIKGGQQNDSGFMFSNSKFNLEYDTMSNQEIMNLRVDKLSKKGFCFLWILSNQINTAYEMMAKWGYEVVDQIIWVKLKNNNIYLSHGYYLMHSFEMCLVGYKCPQGEYVEYNSKISNNVIFGEVRIKSRKPDELYEIIDLMMPGSKKIELFARNHNLRTGWFSLGNQLGENYEKWFNVVNCNNCEKPLKVGVTRYKARFKQNYDLCEECFRNTELDKNDFFMMSNLVDEDVLHLYHSCNHCETEPIWGTRFTCNDCENFDLCEACFDLNLDPDKTFHEVRHNFSAIEVPILASGLPAHLDKKCVSCLQKPILGVCFSCDTCPNLHLCQQCYFTKPLDEIKKVRGHKNHHNFAILTEPSDEESRNYKCSWCEIHPIQDTAYKCENCFSFYFCEKCYLKKDIYSRNLAVTHKYYHSFIPINLN